VAFVQVDGLAGDGKDVGIMCVDGLFIEGGRARYYIHVAPEAKPNEVRERIPTKDYCAAVAGAEEHGWR